MLLALFMTQYPMRTYDGFIVLVTVGYRVAGSNTQYPTQSCYPVSAPTTYSLVVILIIACTKRTWVVVGLFVQAASKIMSGADLEQCALIVT